MTAVNAADAGGLSGALPTKPSRRQQAASTRAKILRAAYDEFCAAGFQATTMAAVGRRAGVAVQTVYFVFGTKSELLIQVWDSSVLGLDDPQPPGSSPWAQAAMAAPDPRAAIRHFLSGTVAILDRVAPLAPVVAAAAPLDPDLAAMWTHREGLRVQGFREFVKTLAERSFLGPGVSVEEATDVLLALVGPGTYGALTRDSGWSLERYTAWLERSVLLLLTSSP